jgi:dTDP-4-amino-4,6-dideoxygalactose transaminase
MLPRRRVPLRKADFVEWSRALLGPGAAPGADVRRFEEAFARYLGCPAALATASGREAIAVALQAAGFDRGAEIIVPAYTLGELLPGLQGLGLTPVPADIEEDTFNMSVAAAAARIGPATRFILATHLLGAPCDISALGELARDKNIVVIEDCAHALGAAVQGRKVGTFGDAAIFSFEPNKAVPTYGGGMLAINKPEWIGRATEILADRRRVAGPALRRAFSVWLEELVIRSPFYGWLARLLFSGPLAGRFEKFYRGSHTRARRPSVAYSDFQARLGLQRLAELDARNEFLNARWNALAAALPPAFVPQKRDAAGAPSFYNFVVRSAVAPDRLRGAAIRRGVDVGVGSQVEDDCAALLGDAGCPVAARTFRQAVLLPLYQSMSEKEVAQLAAVMKNLAQEGAAES